MSKISTYEVVPVPKLADKLIGTSVGGEIEDVTYNFTLQELLDLYIPLMPANNLQGILDFGNTATQDINLFGTITTTYLDVTDTANLYITYLNEETHIVGSVFDSLDLVGTPGQVLTSTGEGVEWYTLPPIFTPNLQQVLTEGNTADIDILLDANLEALDVSADTASIANNITLSGTITDGLSSVGSAGQVLESTVIGVQWVNLPVYSATSPLLFNSATNTFSIQPANSTQGGYLTANDWVTFNGKQDAGSYITALTGEATATGPGSVPITLNNASVIAKVLTGLNVTGGSISAADSILTAFGKVQSQINGLMGGVQYQGVWNADTNTPTLTSSVGTQGHYYIVNVAGSTDLNGITDWKVGDWAIFSGGTWQKVDNTESVTSVNGQTGAVSLTTDDIPEGSTNLYYLNSRARGALSFAAGSGAYNSLTGVITIPTDNNQILNGAGYITLTSLSATAPLTYNNLTGAFGIPKATTLVDGYLSAIDWTTFNNKQNYLGGTGLVKSTAGTITYITDNSGNWNTAYDRSIVSAAVTGTTTKTLTLNEQDGNTITASWTDLDTGLTSVGVSMPSAFSVANSPLTANGTIAITGAGTALEYIDGTGALRTFPGLTGYVPYIGATTNVDLGEYGISAGYFQADLTPTGALQVGRMQWNAADGTMDLRLMGNNVTLQIGEENVTRVVNKSGVDLIEANYQVVRIRKVAEGGAQGQRLAVVLAQGNNENNSTEVLGIVTETILVNQEGFVTNFGEVKQINTTGSLQGETWVDGDVVYLSATTPGQLTNIRPIAPNHAVIVGYVTYAHAVNGKIYVAVDTGYELGELHNVYAPSPANNASIWWNSSTLRYENNTIAGILGYTPANDALVVHLAGTETITGAKTFTTKVTVNTGGVDDQLQLVGAAPSVRLTNAVSGATINGFIAMAGAVNNYIQGAVAGDMTIGNQNNGRILFGFGSGTATQKMSLDSSGNAIIAGSLTLGTTLSNGTYTYTLPGATGTLALTSDLTGYVTAVTASGPLASSGGTTPNITIQQASGSQAGYLSSTDWTTFNNKQAAGNYITSLTGEATASGPGAASVTLNNASVTAKVLTGINITGGTVQATDTMLTAFGKLQNQINGLVGGSIYQGTWNASTNTPALASGVGTKGYYYIVSVAGNTNLDGITDWFVGDWAIFDGTAWQQVDNTDAVVSVNGQTGAVSLTTDNIPEGATNQYFLNSRARAALSFTAGSGAYNSTTGLITIPTNTNQLTNGASFITLASLSGTAPIVYSNTTGAISITQSGTASNGYLSSTDWNTFNNKQNALTNPVTGTGTNNYIAKFTATGSTIGNSIIYDNGSVVSIGTTTTGFNAFGLPLVVGSGAGNQGITVYSGSSGWGSLHFAYGVTGDQSYRGGLEYSHSSNQLNLLAGAGVGLIVGVNQVIVTQSGAHSAGSENFYVQGSARMNNTLSVGGQLTLSSTITNGTYTYTLPGATGTLALTSQIPSVVGVYLPLAGGTMTGQLSSTFISSGGALLLNSGDDSGAAGNRVQIALGYDGSSTYKHYITTTHNNGTGALNRIRFYTSDGVMNGTFPTNAILGLTIENGNISTGQGNFSGNVTLTKNQPDLIFNSTSNTQYSRIVFKENGGTEKGVIEYINSAFSETYRRNKLELVNEGGIDFIIAGIFSAPEFSILSNGNATFKKNVGMGGAAATYPLTVYNASNGTTAGIGGTAYGLRIDNGGDYSAGLTTLFGVDNTFYGSYQPIKIAGSIVYLGIGHTTTVATITSTQASFNFGTGSIFRAVYNGDNNVEIGNYNVANGYRDMDIASSRLRFYTSTAGASSGSLALTLATNQNATFNKSVNLLDGSLTIKTTSFGGLLNLESGTTTDRWLLYHYSPDNTLRFNYNGAGGDEFIMNTVGATTFASDMFVNATIQGTRIAIGGSAYPNVGYTFKGTINGNNDTWGAYQGALTHAPIVNGSLAVGYQAGGGVNRGTFTGLSYRGFMQENITVSGTGTLATAYGVYISALSGATNNYSAYFAQNVGIATVAPDQKLVINQGATGTNQGVPQTTGEVQNGILRLRPAVGLYGETLDFGMNVSPTYAWIQATNAGGLGTNYNISLNPNGGQVLIGTTTNTTTGGFTNTTVGIKQLSDGGSGGGLHIEQYSNTNVAYFGFTGGSFTIGTSYRSSGSYMPISFNTSAASRIFIETNGYVGINNISPQRFLDIKGTADSTNFSSVLIRAGNSDNPTPLSNQILFGYADTGNYAHGIKTRHQSGTQAGNSIEFWVWKYGDAISTPAGQRVMMVEGNGVSIANSSGAVISPVSGSILTVNGSIYASGDVTAFSDISVKNNIRPIENVIKKIINSRGILYDRIDTNVKDNIGFIAQELEKNFPELVITGDDGRKAVKYQNAVAILFEAIKEQQKQIDDLKKQLV